MKTPAHILIGGALCSLLLAVPALAVTNWTGNAVDNDRFSATNNWDNGVPAPGNDGVIDSAPRVEIATLGEMETGATVDFNGSSLLERNSVSGSAFTGVLNINDSTNVKITRWLITNSTAVLNWNSSGTFSLPPAGGTTQSRFVMATTAVNSVVNIYDGFWDLRGNNVLDSIQVDSGTLNVFGGQIITDRRFKVGRGDSTGAVNYYAGAEIRAASMGTITPTTVPGTSVFNFQSGATLYVQSGLLGQFGTEGFEWMRDEMRKGDGVSAIHIDGVRQFLPPDGQLADANFITATVQIEGIWYNAMTAVGAEAFVLPAVTLSQDATDWILSLPSETGRSYQARTATTLGADPATWDAVGDPVDGTDAVIQISVSKAGYPAGDRRFFVVEISE